MAGIAGALGGLAGRGVGIAAQGAAGVAGATTGFVGGMISPLLKFFNDVIKQRIAAADEAAKKREARDDKIVEICEAVWKEDVVIKTLVVEKEVPLPTTRAVQPEGSGTEPKGNAPRLLENAPRPEGNAPRPEGSGTEPKGNAPRLLENAPLRLENSPPISEELALRSEGK
jgi:hypothetical protein